MFYNKEFLMLHPGRKVPNGIRNVSDNLIITGGHEKVVVPNLESECHHFPNLAGCGASAASLPLSAHSR